VSATLSIADRLLQGERSAVARLISWAENSDERFPDALAQIYSRVGRAWRVGITGPPGAGKSTLVNELALLLREQQRTVGILAVDPSSPFSGGALLGDRIRMEDRTLDEGVFIRSMASRGSHGGIARATVDAGDVLDAFGFDDLLIETVGVGQAEYDVMSATDTVVVVLCPGAGDGIQAMKSGLLEVADVLVVNKAELPGAERLAGDLEEAVHLRTAGKREWTPPIVCCSAGTGKDVEAVLEAVAQHRAFLEDGRLDAVRRRKRSEQVKHVVSERLGEVIWQGQGYGALVQTLLDKRHTPYDVAQRVLADLLGKIAAAPPPSHSQEGSNSA
jgi:LAO/AO transport system kinase